MGAETYMDAVRDERIFNKLKSTIRGLPASEISTSVLEVYRANRRVGLRIANACSRDKNLFIHILRDGLVEADLSTIRRWLKCVVPRLGIVATAQVIAATDNCDVLIGDACVYWIEGMWLQMSKREQAALARLRGVLSRRRSAMPQGSRNDG